MPGTDYHGWTHGNGIDPIPGLGTPAPTDYAFVKRNSVWSGTGNIPFNFFETTNGDVFGTTDDTLSTTNQVGDTYLLLKKFGLYIARFECAADFGSQEIYFRHPFVHRELEGGSSDPSSSYTSIGASPEVRSLTTLCVCWENNVLAPNHLRADATSITDANLWIWVMYFPAPAVEVADVDDNVVYYDSTP